jgi:(E)-4-hydroxy-3-methylbut-2-enyl-diphosphate synthase
MLKSGDLPLYCDSLFQYNRNPSAEVRIGNVLMGQKHPLRLQSMTTTNTLNTEATVQQCIRIFNAGGELVRITTQGKREAANLEVIKKEIKAQGYDFPLVADIHFNPDAAAEAALHVEKVRINPGNFADGAKKFKDIHYTDESYLTETEYVKAKLIPFLEICRKNGTAIRIGTNHGSLSDRIMARYGDTPKGMVESIMEYLRICRGTDFHDIVLSIKSSNTRVMLHTVRLLTATMKSEGMNFPLHLGVTEAGSGEDGRIKSAVGIGALLADGLGDTIRVSLTEDPEKEIPVARLLKEQFEKIESHPPILPVETNSYFPYEYVKRKSHKVSLFGDFSTTAVVVDIRGSKIGISKLIPEAVITESKESPLPKGWEHCLRIIPEGNDPANLSELVLYTATSILKQNPGHPKVVLLKYPDLTDEVVSYLINDREVIILLSTNHINGIAEQRAFFMELAKHNLTHPVIIHRTYPDCNKDALQVTASADTGMLFLDGYGDGLSVHAPDATTEELTALHFGILQASRVRFSRTEYISCPGCGRTLFDLQSTTVLIREKTSHLKGLKIAIMGCIVNGIGEMADADYGYVGGSHGKVSLFRNRELVEKNIPEKDAVEKLVQLIIDNGDWVDPL